MGALGALLSLGYWIGWPVLMLLVVGDAVLAVSRWMRIAPLWLVAIAVLHGLMGAELWALVAQAGVGA